MWKKTTKKTEAWIDVTPVFCFVSTLYFYFSKLLTDSCRLHWSLPDLLLCFEFLTLFRVLCWFQDAAEENGVQQSSSSSHQVPTLSSDMSTVIYQHDSVKTSRSPVTDAAEYSRRDLLWTVSVLMFTDQYAFKCMLHNRWDSLSRKGFIIGLQNNALIRLFILHAFSR